MVQPSSGEVVGMLKQVQQHLSEMPDSDSQWLNQAVGDFVGEMEAPAALPVKEWGTEVSPTKPAGGVYVEEIDGVDAGDVEAGFHYVRLTVMLPGGGEEAVILRPGQGARLVLRDAPA